MENNKKSETNPCQNHAVEQEKQESWNDVIYEIQKDGAVSSYWGVLDQLMKNYEVPRKINK